MTMYAFPSGHNPKTGTQESGMTLRDYFAAAALSCISLPATIRHDEPTIDTSIAYAKLAYEVADQMMKARDK